MKLIVMFNFVILDKV